MNARKCLFFGLILIASSPGAAIQISEIMYHPKSDEAHLEYVEIYNETSARRDLSGWAFTKGIKYTFTSGTVIEPHAYLVIARDPATIMTSYSITNVVGPYEGALDNDGEKIVLCDPAGGAVAEVRYHDDGKWPVAADGAGHSLAKFNMRGNPNDPDNWRASVEMGGTPGKDNGFEPWFEDTELISVGETWRYFKGTSEPSDPIDAWRQIGFDDSGWLSGPTGIGYGDGDDATVLSDMRYTYISIFCRKTFTVADPSAIDHLVLEVDFDDGFVAYLNGTEVGRGSMPSGPIAYDTPAILHEASGGDTNPQPPMQLDITSYKSLLVAGTNVLAVEVHNANLSSSDLSFIPRLLSRTVHEPGSSVVINEVSFNTSGTQFIELYNKSASPVDISGFYLSNDPDNLELFQVTSPTILPGHGHVAFLETELGFTINPAGDRILLTTPSATAVVDARAVEAGPFEMSEGRWPDGADKWYYMAPTTGTANTVELTTSVVISEIMYHPPTGNVDDEYIELYNTGNTTVDLTGWRFSRGVRFDFPAGTTIGPGRYLVVAKNRDRLISRYGLNPAIVLGNYSGQLDDSGEKIRLRDANNNVADEVTYYEGGHWPRYADGYGSSLELRDPFQDNNNYQNWAPSDETSKSNWGYISYSGVVYVSSNPEQQELHFHLMGPGEVLIDNIHLRRGTTEYIANGSFESGLGNWLIMGNHIQSHVTTEDAYDGTHCLKIVATGRGDTGANHIEQDVSTPMQSGQTYTISFCVKWLWGNRVLVTRCYNNQMPETHILPIPLVTGTPGAPNTAYCENLGPVFSDVAHSPVIPGSSTQVQITARVYDPDGVASVTLHYKADSDGSYSTTAMYDDGLHGDGEAGDGLYGGLIPPRTAGQTVAFYLSATDGEGTSNTWPTDPSKPALYRVENNPLTSSFPTYRIILTDADANLLASRPHLSNEPLNCTFIFDEKEVYYNCGVRYIGSPFHRGGNDYTGYKVTFNADQKFHGTRLHARVDDNPGGPYHDRLSYGIQARMGLPNCQQEWVFVRFNGTSHGVWEDTQPPGRLYLRRYYPGDDDGYLFELDDRFVFTNNDDTNLANFNIATTTFEWFGSDKDVYRHNYEIRNHDNDDDYTSIIAMLDVMNNTPLSQYDEEIAKIINVEEWFKVFAIRAAISDWDFFAFTRGKNAYLYWPLERGKWDVLAWDSELTFGRTDMSIWSNFAPVRKFQQRGRHQHFYYSYLKEVLDKYFNHAYLDPWINYYSSLVGGNPSGDKSFIDARRSYLLGLIPNGTVQINTNGGNPFTVSGLTAQLIGTAPVEVRWIRIGNRIYTPDWVSAITWKVTVLLHPGENDLLLEFLDYDQRVVGTDSIVITSTSASEVEDWKQY